MLRRNWAAPRQLFDSQNGLNYLAAQTGGLAIRNTNDMNDWR